MKNAAYGDSVTAKNKIIIDLLQLDSVKERR